MPSSTMIHVRIDDRLKAQATATLAAMGLTLSDAVRVFLKRVVAEQQFPFDLRTSKAEKRLDIENARAMARARGAEMEALIDSLRKASRK